MDIIRALPLFPVRMNKLVGSSVDAAIIIIIIIIIIIRWLS